MRFFRRKRVRGVVVVLFADGEPLGLDVESGNSYSLTWPDDRRAVSVIIEVDDDE